MTFKKYSRSFQQFTIKEHVAPEKSISIFLGPQRERRGGQELAIMSEAALMLIYFDNEQSVPGILCI